MPPRPEEPLAAATGGWDDERLLDPANVDDDLRCPICSSLCRDAVQCNAQHAFCAVCIHQWLERRQTCPLGNEPLTMATLEPARFVRRLIDKHLVHCDFTAHGCAEALTIETIEAHERACGFRLVSCAHAGHGCLEVMCRHDMEVHETGCGFAGTSCRRCGHELLRKDHDAHHDSIACVQVLADGMRGLQQEHLQQMQQMQQRLREQEQRLREQEQQTQQRLREQEQQMQEIQERLREQEQQMQEMRDAVQPQGVELVGQAIVPDLASHPRGAVLQVVGAGEDSVNGLYKADGDCNGKPKYKKVRQG